MKSESQEKESEDLTKLNKEKKTVVYKRYYHVFKENELEDLVNQFQDVEITDRYYDHANWVVRVKKLK